LTYLGLSLPIVLSGALVVEALFNLPGLGYYLYLCAQAKQLLLSVELGVILFTATAVVLVTMLIDIVIRLIDPRS
jgi:peptide/nickel transport system permease protein